MSKFPVELTDDGGIVDAVNYLLSGPQGLGQFFKGFSSYTGAYLTGNYRIPFTQVTYNRYATGTLGAFTIDVDDATSLSAGMLVSGTGIGVGATVVSVSNLTVTLSVANTATVDNTVLFEPAVIPKLYVAPINCSSAVQLDDRTFKYIFSVPQPTPPFANGNNIIGTGWATGFYNGGTGPIGVAECTTTYAIFRTNGSYPGIGDDLGGGQVYWNATVDDSNTPIFISTDCNARVITTGATDRVFVSAQLNNLISYTATVASDMTYTVAINRYIAQPNYNPINPDFVFTFDKTISEKTYSYTGLTGTATLSDVETIFTTVIDNPKPQYYWYILEVKFATTAGDLQVNQNKFYLRSLSAQVVKE